MNDYIIIIIFRLFLYFDLSTMKEREWYYVIMIYMDL